MAQIRKPYQGVWNIVRFNWHFYVVVQVLLLLFIILNNELPKYAFVFNIAMALLILTMLISLLVSFYVYDISKLYSFNWIKQNAKPLVIVNINAGFDETSELLKQKFINSTRHVFDFYDEKKHTEISIKRARKAYPLYPNTISISTDKISLENDSADIVFLIFAAHEIRNDKERELFFTEINRILKPDGELIVVEHLRDVPNFIAYNIGSLHFLPYSKWLATFSNSNFNITQKIKHTPFITSFTLKKNGYTL
jgi:ubiquinone/menaquinone biosynthesis C-methylase UbiE